MYFSHTDFDNHEQCTFINDPKTNLRAIICIHSTSLGASLGGCRILNYANDADAITDALRLSRGMTYKAAIAGLNLGGGKSVILLGKGQQKTPEMMRSLGRAIKKLNGKYIVAEDVGATPEDMADIAKETFYVSGLAHKTGDPSPWTAKGVFLCLKQAVEMKLNKTLAETSVSVKGLGSVGFELCRLLHEAGSCLVVSDLVEERVFKAINEFDATACYTDVAHLQNVDVFSPCALGADLNETTIPEIRAHIICGGANNQLATPHDDGRLYQRKILYCPDYLVNAGGVINVSRPVLGLSESDATKKLMMLVETLKKVINETVQRNVPTGQVADYIAKQRFMK